MILALFEDTAIARFHLIFQAICDCYSSQIHVFDTRIGYHDDDHPRL